MRRRTPRDGTTHRNCAARGQIQRVRVRGRLFARRLQERRVQDRAVRRGEFLNTEAGKMLPLTRPLASRFTAASIGLREEVLFNAEKRRSRDSEGESCERMGVIFSADFIKCAGERKPHFIKCGFGEAAEMAVELEVA